MRIKYLILILVLLLIPSMGYSANCGASPDIYYVDFAAGDDTANGTADSTPWKHAPGDDSATDTAACSLQAGDTVIFKGGVSYKGRVDIDVSGSEGALITYDGNSAGSWGTGRAIIDGEYTDTDARRHGFYTASSRSYVTIQNFEIKRMGGLVVNTACPATNSSSGYGIHFADGGTYITIKDSKIWDIVALTNALYSDRTTTAGYGIYFTGVTTHILIDNVEFTKIGVMSIGFKPEGSSNNIEIKNCHFLEETVWSVYFGFTVNSTTLQDISIHHNYFDTPMWTEDWLGCGGTNPHLNGVFFTGGASTLTSIVMGSPEHPIKIYNNSFYTDSAVDSLMGTANIFLTGFGGTVYIYNNTFKNSLSANATIYAQGGHGQNAADYHIYNNSFYIKYKAFYVNDLGGTTFSGRTAIDFSNNVVYCTSTALYAIIEATEIEYFTAINNNIIHGKRSDGKFVYDDGELAYTMTTLNALDNADGNIASDPLFTDITTYGRGANSSLNDLTLQAGSPGLNVGTDLSAYFTTDFAGNTRPTGANTWDLGAYERGASGDATAPTLLSATIASNGTALTLGFSEPVDTTINTGFAITASGGAATLTYASGTGSNSLVYTINRAIAQSETATVAYTQPGNGIEDVADNDLASFSGSSITNNSIQGDPPVYELAITKGASIGTITSVPTGIDCGATCSHEYDGGTAVQLHISCVNEGWYVSSITGDCASDGSVTMSAAKACTVACSEVKLWP